MAKHFWKNPRPLVFSLCAMTFLCVLLLVLYGLAEKENDLLRLSRSEQFLALAAGEAEEAEEAWKKGSPAAEVYHRICSAAQYLTMAAPTEENRRLIAELRDAGKILLEGNLLPDSTEDSLQAIRRQMTDSIPVMGTQTDPESQKTETVWPWQDMPCISRKEGLKIAETLTQTKNCLTPAAGKFFVYTCRNVYVRLSHHGGVPVEIAVYTPVRKESSYSDNTCAFRSSRFLEAALPRRFREKNPVREEQTSSGYRFFYPCGEWQVTVDVRSDTGRITGLQMVPA